MLPIPVRYLSKWQKFIGNQQAGNIYRWHDVPYEVPHSSTDHHLGDL
jgi:hypothetical protein